MTPARKTPEQLERDEAYLRDTLANASGAVAQSHNDRLRGGASALRSFALHVERAMTETGYDHEVVNRVIEMARETADGLERMIP